MYLTAAWRNLLRLISRSGVAPVRLRRRSDNAYAIISLIALTEDAIDEFVESFGTRMPPRAAMDAKAAALQAFFMGYQVMDAVEVARGLLRSRLNHPAVAAVKPAKVRR
jgi:hypothetical protein